MIDRCRLVVLVSGSGSNLQAILDACQSGAIHADVVAVFSNRSDALGLVRAAKAGIASASLDHTRFASREEFDAAMMQLIDQQQPDLVLLAGFMRILSAGFVQHYLGRLLNIHPSLLPKYKGLQTHQRALDAGDQFHGASVHFVTPELDGGPVIIQSRLKIRPDHSAETLAQELLAHEHRLYPLVAGWFCIGKIQYVNGSAVWNGELLPQPLQLQELETQTLSA